MNYSLTENIDVAQVVLYLFWLFFAGLIFYLRREDRREGYPLESDKGGRVGKPGPILMAAPKEFLLADGDTKQAPSYYRDARPIAAERTAPWSGAPLEPTGDPMLDGVGPAAYAERKDEPERTRDGSLAIVPLRVATDFHVAEGDVDPRGAPVLGADGGTAGAVVDLWVDRADPMIRYLEVELTGGAKKVLVPMNAARLVEDPVKLEVRSILSGQFTNVPALANPDQITVLEEDKVCAYFAGGRLFAEPSRREPKL